MLIEEPSRCIAHFCIYLHILSYPNFYPVMILKPYQLSFANLTEPNEGHIKIVKMSPIGKTSRSLGFPLKGSDKGAIEDKKREEFNRKW
jgi:hypothetical protein